MITHISSVHEFHDTRIQRHLSSSLGSIFIGIGNGNGPQQRSIFSTRNVFTRLLFSIIILFNVPSECSKAVFHDPELIVSAWLLKLFKNKNVEVYFDAHEDVLKDIKQKIWLNIYLRKVLLQVFNFIFNWFLPRLDGIITVNQRLETYYRKFNKRVILIPNYPMRSELSNSRRRKLSSPLRDLKLCYVGSISVNRGIKKILEIALEVNHPIILIGSFTDDELFRFAQSHPGWENIDFKGHVQHKNIAEIIGRCQVGLLLLEDIETFRDSTPVKIFDYGMLNLLVLWTGSEDCNYKKYLAEDISGIKIGTSLSSIDMDYDMKIDTVIDNDLSSYCWESEAGNFY